MMKAAMNSIRLAWNGNVESHLPHWRCNLQLGIPAPTRKQYFVAAEGRLAEKRIGGPVADTSNIDRG